VAKARPLRLELLRFCGVGLRSLDLRQLEAQHVEVALPRALALAQLGELALDP
jgi:hypothetical protein